MLWGLSSTKQDAKGPHEISLSEFGMSFTDNPEEGRVAQLTGSSFLKLI